MKKIFLVVVSILCMTIGCQCVYSQISSSYPWLEKGKKYTAIDLGFDLPQNMPDGYSSFNISSNIYEGLNVIDDLGIELGAGIVMNALHKESTLKEHSYYSKLKKRWIYSTSGEKASTTTTFALQLIPGVRYTISNINMKASMELSSLKLE